MIIRELQGRVIANPGFRHDDAVFILAQADLDIVLRLYAPGMADDAFTKLCKTLGDRLNAALADLNDKWIYEIHHDEEFNHIRIAINDPNYEGGPAIDIVLPMAAAIVQASGLALYRRIITLKERECAVLVDWDEPFVTHRREFTLTLPAQATGLAGVDQQQLHERLNALCDENIRMDVAVQRGTVTVTLWSTDIGGIGVYAARQHITRALVVLGTLVKPGGVYDIPIVQLSRPFAPSTDDGCE